MNDSVINIHADNIDTARIVEEIRKTVAEKARAGFYRDPLIARAERNNMANLRHSDEFWDFYLESLQDFAQVDINDYEIVERRSKFSRLLVALKKTIWALLRFYTYRLWSQQNQINSLLLASVSGSREGLLEKIRTLEARLDNLEKRQTPPKP